MKKFIKLGMAVLVMSILANLFFGGSADKDADIPKLIKDGALVIDVRTANEFSGGHIEGAVNIPYDTIAHDIEKHEAARLNSIIVYCRSGRRSAIAKQTLEQMGYSHVVNGGSLHGMRKSIAE